MKNEIKKLYITDISNEGLGIARDNNFVYFVKNAVVGDLVNCIITKETKNIIYAKVVDVIEKSKYRCESICQVSNPCGGCQLLDVKYEKQLEIKKNIVINNLIKIGKIDRYSVFNIFNGIVGMDYPFFYRNKMQIPFGDRNNEVIYGFYANRTHYIIPNKNCVVGFRGYAEILNSIKEFVEMSKIPIYDENKKTGILREVLLRSSNYNDSCSREVSITLIINDKNYKENLRVYRKFVDYILERNYNGQEIKTICLNINTNDTNVILGLENCILYGDGFIEDNILDIKYKIFVNNFYQINMEMTKKLYSGIIDYAKLVDFKNVLDLYCGIGTITLQFSKFAKKVLGIEVVKESIETANINKKINNIKNVDFLCRDIEKLNIVDLNCEKENFDLICVDPPRKGLNKSVIEKIVKINPKRIIYVSCDSATLARDINFFANENYKLECFKLYDMFPHTMHIETVALLSKK